MTTANKIHREWVALVKSFGIDRVPRSQRGFIGTMLLNAIYQRNNKGTLTTLLKEQETNKIS